MKIKYALVIAGVLGVAYFSSACATWDTSTPSGTEAKSLGDDRIREFKTDVQTALNAYGVFPGTDTANPKYVWTISSGTTSGRPYVGISTGTLYVNVSSGCIERYLGVQGWTCVQTVNPNFELNASTLTITTNNETVYDYVTGGVANILNIRNTAADTSTATASVRFWVGNANEAKIVAIRDPSASDSLDLAINMRKNGTRYQPIRWRGDGTTLHMSSNTYTGTSLFNSSVTFTSTVTFSNVSVGVSSLTWKGFGVLPILQIQNFEVSTASSVTNTTFVLSPVQVSITPKLATSKMLIMVNGIASVGNSAGNDGLFTIGRSGTNIAGGTNFYVAIQPGGPQVDNVAITAYDSPATTSAITYSVMMHGESGNNVDFPTAAFGGTGNAICSITVMEIAQ